MPMTGRDVVLKRNTVGPIFHLRDESLDVSHVGFLRVLTANIHKIQYKNNTNTHKHSS